MNIKRKQISIRAKLLALSITMLVVTPGGAVQTDWSSAKMGLIEAHPAAKIVKQVEPIKRVKRRVRDCSLGIPCRRNVAGHRVKRGKAMAFAVMMGLGAKPKG